jgi:hypothetical protein
MFTQQSGQTDDRKPTTLKTINFHFLAPASDSEAYDEREVGSFKLVQIFRWKAELGKFTLSYDIVFDSEWGKELLKSRRLPEHLIDQLCHSRYPTDLSLKKSLAQMHLLAAKFEPKEFVIDVLSVGSPDIGKFF